MGAQRARLDDRRWHWSHGPIDIVAEADGDAAAVEAAHARAWARFAGLLDELVAELPLLRAPVAGPCLLRGPVARCMWQACAPLRPGFITPMAAVAGSVAQALIGFYDAPGIRRAWLNNGGDIALHLAPGQQVEVGLFADLSRFAPGMAGALPIDGRFRIDAAQPVRGVATSGWRGRSLSLGIADSVTVLAATASQADAAATVIANAVDVAHPGVRRAPASACKDDTDLGDLPVTVEVAALPPSALDQALAAGAARAAALQARGLIHAAMLVCQGRHRMVQPLSSSSLSRSRAAAGSGAVGSVLA